MRKLLFFFFRSALMNIFRNFIKPLKRVLRRFNPLRPQPSVASHRISSDLLPKALGNDLLGRMREILSDPLNVLIERNPSAGFVDNSGLVCLHNGVLVPITGELAYYEDFSSILILNRGVHEPLEEFVFQELLKKLGPEPSMLELGAYWSHYSMWLKSLRPKSSVTMVEPDAHNIEVGKHNFALNGLSGQFIRAEVSEQGFSVDAFLSRLNGRLTILHADIQGYEKEMLYGARNSLSNRAIDFLFVSTHSESLHADCLGQIASAGYVVEVESAPDKHSTSYDGFIFASSPEVGPVLGGFKPRGRHELAVATSDELVRYLRAALNQEWPP